MDLPSFIRPFAKSGTEIKTIEMHTTGEPTRIVYAGYPDLTYADILYYSHSYALTLKVVHYSNSARKPKSTMTTSAAN